MARQEEQVVVRTLSQMPPDLVTQKTPLGATCEGHSHQTWATSVSIWSAYAMLPAELRELHQREHPCEHGLHQRFLSMLSPLTAWMLDQSDGSLFFHDDGVD